MKGITIRKSVKTDVNAIDRIVKACFGTSRDDYLLGVESGRYYIAVVDGNVVAISGIYPDSPYGDGDPEVDWTGCLPYYRKRGIMTKLFEVMLKDAPPTLYYSAWRNSRTDWERATAQPLIQKFGFEEVIHEHLTWTYGHNCTCRDDTECVERCDERECHCYEDLWVRRI